MLSRIINLSLCSAKSMAFSKNISVMRPITAMSFHTSNIARGFEEFYDQSEKNELLITGRAWTAADLRRKVRH